MGLNIKTIFSLATEDKDNKKAEVKDKNKKGKK